MLVEISQHSKTGLLFSGGLDSVVAAYLFKPDTLISIPINSVYSNAEKRCIDRLRAETFLSKFDYVNAENILDLSSLERPDFIVPNRNALLVLVASLYADTLIIGAMDGDRSSDKDNGFVLKIESLLNHMWQEQHWTDRRTFKVRLPLKSVTKTQAVKRYLEEGGESEALLVSYSCYSGMRRHCGECKPCFRKWVALSLNNVEMDGGYFKSHPAKNEWVLEKLPLLITGRYRGSEDAEWISALSMVGEI